MEDNSIGNTTRDEVDHKRMLLKYILSKIFTDEPTIDQLIKKDLVPTKEEKQPIAPVKTEEINKGLYRFPALKAKMESKEAEQTQSQPEVTDGDRS